MIVIEDIILEYFESATHISDITSTAQKMMLMDHNHEYFG